MKLQKVNIQYLKVRI